MVKYSCVVCVALALLSFLSFEGLGRPATIYDAVRVGKFQPRSDWVTPAAQVPKFGWADKVDYELDKTCYKACTLGVAVGTAVIIALVQPEIEVSSVAVGKAIKAATAGAIAAARYFSTDPFCKCMCTRSVIKTELPRLDLFAK